MVEQWISAACKRSSSLLVKRTERSRAARMTVVAEALAKLEQDATDRDMDAVKARYSQLMGQCGRSGDIDRARQIQAELKQLGNLDRSTYLGNLLVQMFGQCGLVEEASRVFDRIEARNVYSWNILLAAFVQNGRLEPGCRIFWQLVPRRNEVTWTILLTAYSRRGQMQAAKDMFRKMPRWTIMVWNGMMSMHSRDGDSGDAKYLFDRLPQRDVVTWNVMITANALRPQQLDDAKLVFDKMPQRDAVSWTALTAALSHAGRAEEAKLVFDTSPELSPPSWNAMITAYSLRAKLRQALEFFHKMPQHGIVSWNAMLAALAQNGSLAGARRVFNDMKERDLVTWNSMVTAYAHGGHYDDTLELLHAMSVQGFVPEEVTMVSVLNVCSHAGKFKEGCQYYLSATGDFGIQPSYELYLCMVDLLGRSGRVKESEELIREMPFVPDAIPWTMLLGACKMHDDVERGSRAAEALVQLQPRESATYVLVSNMWT